MFVHQGKNLEMAFSFELVSARLEDSRKLRRRNGRDLIRPESSLGSMSIRGGLQPNEISVTECKLEAGFPSVFAKFQQKLDMGMIPCSRDTQRDHWALGNLRCMSRLQLSSLPCLSMKNGRLIKIDNTRLERSVPRLWDNSNGLLRPVDTITTRRC